MTVPSRTLISWSTQTTALGDDGDLEARAFEHSVAFDAVTSITVEGTSVLTEHAVESGAPISDHKRANPRRITIEAVVSNTPIDRPPASGYGEASTVEVRTTKPDDGSGNVQEFLTAFDRIQDVIDTLDRLRLEATAVTLSTGRRTFEAVQIVSVSEPREVEDGDTQRFTIEIQEVRIAQSRTVDAPRPREPRGARERDRGGQEGAGADSQSTSAITAARDEYNRRIEAGESRWDAAQGAGRSAFGFGG